MVGRSRKGKVEVVRPSNNEKKGRYRIMKRQENIRSFDCKMGCKV